MSSRALPANAARPSARPADKHQETRYSACGPLAARGRLAVAAYTYNFGFSLGIDLIGSGAGAVADAGAMMPVAGRRPGGTHACVGPISQSHTPAMWQPLPIPTTAMKVSRASRRRIGFLTFPERISRRAREMGTHGKALCGHSPFNASSINLPTGARARAFHAGTFRRGGHGSLTAIPALAQTETKA